MQTPRGLVLFLVSVVLTSMLSIGGCSSSSAPSEQTLSNNYLPLSTGMGWRYKTHDSTATRAVIGTISELGNEFTMIRDYSKNDTSYWRKVDSQYISALRDNNGVPMVQSVLFDETPNIGWSSLVNFNGTLATGDFHTYPVTGDMTINGKSYSNNLSLYWVAVHVTQGVKDTVKTTEFYSRGIGETLLITNGDTTESLLEYHL